MPWTIPHPDDATWLARYGHDPERGGAWAELTYNDVLVVYDAAAPDYDVEWPVRGVLRVLATFGFVANDDVDAAFEWLGNSKFGNFEAGPQGRRRAPKRVRRVLKVIRDLELAGG